jgi:hypothetical protein
MAALNIAALAQDKRFEVAVSAGYSVASGFDVNPVAINDTKITP